MYLKNNIILNIFKELILKKERKTLLINITLHITHKRKKNLYI